MLVHGGHKELNMTDFHLITYPPNEKQKKLNLYFINILSVFQFFFSI